MAEIGFDSAKVWTSISGISNGFSDFKTALIDENQSNFISAVADAWYTEDAVKYMLKYKNTIDNYLESMRNTIDSLISAINTNASNHASWTGNSYSPKTANLPTGKLDVSAVQSQKGGKAGLDDWLFPSLWSKVRQVEEHARTALTSVRTAAHNSGFLNSQETQELISTINTIENKMVSYMDDVYQNLKSMGDNVLASAQKASQQNTSNFQING